MDEMTLAQEETVTTIFNLLKSIWGKAIFHKAKRFSMSLPSKRPRSTDLETKNGPDPQKVKSEDTPVTNVDTKNENETKKEDLEEEQATVQD